jgi:hypothetical protein
MKFKENSWDKYSLKCKSKRYGFYLIQRFKPEV